ncbi:MAG: triphosphoribosyl-dephospho-CoA synthase [Candidatus Hodarchaeota archaeon]
MYLQGTNFNISIKSVEDLIRCLSLASLLEVAGWPKPGNVHRTKDYEHTKFEHFLAGIVAIQPNFREFCEKIFQIPFKNEDDYEKIEMGLFFKKATKEVIKWQSGGNVLLGHILILTPLSAAATICIKKKQYHIDDLKFNLKKVIEKSTVQDTVNMYEAIRLCKPGGLGKIKKYDINDENSINDIISDKINIKRIFDRSKEYDLISLEYSTGFNIILNEGVPYFFNIFRQYNDINIATVNTFLKLLSLNPDTLIIRKSGMDSALYVSRKATKILEYGGLSTDQGLRLLIDLDNELQEKNGRLNPGTTADLISGVIFTSLLFGLRF